MKPALFILGLVLIALLTVRGAQWSGALDGPLVQGMFNGQIVWRF